MDALKNAWEDILHLFFPRVCAICDTALMRGEEGLCAHCLDALPRSRFGLLPDNPAAKIFHGRVPLSVAGSYLVFRPGGMVQDLLHDIKYRGKKELAETLGRLYSTELLGAGLQKPDLLVPVPLHPRKERQRGYNQSTHFAAGLAEILGAEVAPDALRRNSYTDSQTSKGRWSRWENVGNVFSARLPEQIRGKNIIITDDVVTTGATLEACVRAALEAGAASTGVLTMAFASRS